MGASPPQILPLGEGGHARLACGFQRPAGIVQGPTNGSSLGRGAQGGTRGRVRSPKTSHPLIQLPDPVVVAFKAHDRLAGIGEFYAAGQCAFNLTELLPLLEIFAYFNRVGNPLLRGNRK